MDVVVVLRAQPFDRLTVVACLRASTEDMKSGQD
jgi:hypothetical protein